MNVLSEPIQNDKITLTMSEKFRADAGAVKELTGVFGLDFVRGWQRAPFFDVATPVYEEYQGDEELFSVKLGDTNKPLPYDDFILRLVGLFPESLDAFVRIMTPLAYAQMAMQGQTDEFKQAVLRSAMHPDKYILESLREPMLCVLMGVFYIKSKVPSSKNLVVLTSVMGKTRIAHLLQRGPMSFKPAGAASDVFNDMRELIHTGANNTVSYLMRSPKHLLQVRPTQPRVNEKTARIKPWLRDDLPVIVLMGPDEAIAAGQPRGDGNSGRKTPRAHARRGHWRRLGAADDGTIRKTYVRPAWIGPEVWEHHGRQYSVLTPSKS